MVAISKNKKIRNSAEKELNVIKNKLTNRFYNKLKDEIQTKRIDAVKRLIDSFKILAKSNKTGIKSGNFKETVQNVKTSASSVIKTNLQKQMTRRVKNQSILIENPEAGQIFNELMSLKKSPGVDGSVRVSARSGWILVIMKYSASIPRLNLLLQKTQILHQTE